MKVLNQTQAIIRGVANCSVPETVDEKKKTIHVYLCLDMAF